MTGTCCEVELICGKAEASGGMNLRRILFVFGPPNEGDEFQLFLQFFFKVLFWLTVEFLDLSWVLLDSIGAICDKSIVDVQMRPHHIVIELQQ